MFGIKSIFDIDRSWSLFSDYKSARSFMRERIDAKGGFDKLNDIEKKIAAKWFLATEEQILEQYPRLDDRINNGKFFNRNSIEARKRRWLAGVELLRNVLNKQNSIILIGEAIPFQEVYITYGIESLEEDGVFGIFNWINETLREKNFETNVPGLTKSMLCDKLYAIFKSGKY